MIAFVQSEITRRLRRGPADEVALSGWCCVHLRALRPVLEQMRRRRLIRRHGNRYALPPNPLSPAGPIVLPQYRWGSTRLS